MNYDSRKETKEHIQAVDSLVQVLCSELLERGKNHDATKLLEPEKSVFDEFTPKLKDSTYGSDEYKGYLAEMQVALEHHYGNNRHHPEHFANGIQGMNLIDLCEMIADWKVATQRHTDGDILKSIDINQKRFGYSDELKQILINTVALLDGE